jgi:hypothetical protein
MLTWAGAYVVKSLFDTWNILGECNGATWPSLGIPCGTPPLVVVDKVVWTPWFSNL